MEEVIQERPFPSRKVTHISSLSGLKLLLLSGQLIQATNDVMHYKELSTPCRRLDVQSVGTICPPPLSTKGRGNLPPSLFRISVNLNP